MNQKLTASSKPWYRHPWPWFLMSGPFIVIVAGAITTYLAVVTNDGLVDDDYYKQGLAVNQLTARDQRAITLGLQADLLQSVEQSSLRILLRGNASTVLPEKLRLRISHPTRAGVDQNLSLQKDGDGVYAGKLEKPLTGRWHIALEDDKRDWRLAGEWIIEKNASLRLPVTKSGVTESVGAPDNIRR